jgi:hypothetical protein
VSWFTNANAWILEHQAFVVALGVPILTAFVAAVVSWLTNRSNIKAQERARALQRATKIAEFREAWMNELREDFARLSSIHVAAMRKDANVKVEELIEVGTRILIRMNREDPDFPAVERLMARALDYFGRSSDELKELDEKYASDERLVRIAQRILKREWDRVKLELEVSEK